MVLTVCVDFRKLNKITEVDPEPMTTAEDVFFRLSGKNYLSKIDLTKGYWQIPVAPEDVDKTAFVTPDGQYEFLQMPYGMVKSGATLDLMKPFVQRTDDSRVGVAAVLLQENKGKLYPVGYVSKKLCLAEAKYLVIVIE